MISSNCFRSSSPGGGQRLDADGVLYHLNG